jgi:hypothetical protein
MRRVVRGNGEGGVVSVRESDYASMLAFPEYEGIEKWREMYHQVCHRNKAFPDAGRELKSWAIKAGFRYVPEGFIYMAL